MNAGQLAALIAAAFFAIAMCAAVYVLVRLARLISAATALVTSYQAGAEDVLARSRAAVERADQQLARTGALADGVDAVAASMSDLSVQVSAVARTARLIASGLGSPVLRVAAAAHGVRHALAVRRTRTHRETWRERTERVRAARDLAVLDSPAGQLDRPVLDQAVLGRGGLDQAVLDRGGLDQAGLDRSGR
jgi:hypothetical protein